MHVVTTIGSFGMLGIWYLVSAGVLCSSLVARVFNAACEYMFMLHPDRNQNSCSTFLEEPGICCFHAKYHAGNLV